LQSSALKILIYITGHRILQASQVAFETNHIRLASMITQCAEAELHLSKDIEKQIANWEKTDVWNTFTDPHKIIYSLLSGNIKNFR